MATIGLLQLDIVWENVTANIAKIRGLLADTGPGEVDLLVLPELWSCGFTMNREAHKTFDAGLAFMHELSDAWQCAVLGGLPAPVAGGQENRCYLVTGDQSRYYAKIKVFKYAGEHEKYLPGETSCRWSVAGFVLSPFICYDLRFPELARPMVPETDLFSYVACWPSTRVHHWRALLIARAIENQAYVIGCNRVGRDGAGLGYPGSSMIVGPKGEIVLDAGDSEGFFRAEITPETVATVRDELPFLKDI